MDLAARACFAPDAAMSTFTKLGAVEKKMGVSIPRFLRTHPLSEARPRAPVLPSSRCSHGLSLAYLRAPHAALSRFPQCCCCHTCCSAACVHVRPQLTCAVRMQERVQALMRHLPKARNWAEIEGCSVSLTGFESDLMPMLMDPLPRQAVRPAPGRPAAAQQQTPDTDDPFDF